MYMLTVSTVLLIAVLTAVQISDAAAETPERKRAQPIRPRFETNFDQRHDRGPFVRLDLGLGWVDRTVANGPVDVVDMSGVGVFPAAAAGAMPWNQTAIHGGAWGMIGRGIVTVGAGPGVTYYFKETGNLWIGAQLGPVASSRQGRPFAEWGFGGELAAGLFGWTGDRWSMGGSLFAGGEAFDLDGNGRAVRSWRVGLRFGAAFN